MIKSLFDKTLALFLIILFSPIYIIVSLLILMKMGCPILFRQKRPGLDEKIFSIYKFRTMINETLCKELNILSLNHKDGTIY